MIGSMALTHRVLLLNASFEAMTTVSAQRAVVLLMEGNAETVLDREDEFIHSAHSKIPYPSVIRLVRYVNVPRFRKAYLTRKAVLARDSYTCAYCGEQKGLKDMTMDHIVPRSKGGQHTWKNVIACCFNCNQRKGDRSLEELGWTLRFGTYRPDGSRRIAIIAGHVDPEWEPWLSLDAPR